MISDYIKGLIDQGKLKHVIKDEDMSFSLRGMDAVIGKDPFVIAGPCSVESRDMISKFAISLADIGVDALRGGAYKPCTFPVREQVGEWQGGVGYNGLRYLSFARMITGLPIVTEVMSADMVGAVAEYADMIQVGMRNFQNYTLLDALGVIDKPVLLKRGSWATLDEILGAVDRIMEGGNKKVAICLRGVVGMPSYRHIHASARWAPDLMMIPALKEFTNVPIVYDPSHATGHAAYVEPMARAAMAAGADGLIVESHPDPRNSVSDPDQAIGINTLQRIVEYVKNG